MPVTRYAIYFTPPPGAFAARGAAWLGWDSATGQPAGPPDPGDMADLPAQVHEITEAPRKYGLHATIAPPFRLADGQTEADLHAAFTATCRRAAPVTLEALELAAMGRFLALVPAGPTTQAEAKIEAPVGALAAEMLHACDTLRARPSAAELARRRAARLTPDQEANLIRWGYPYVMSAFRFHITLTGKRPRTEHAAIRAVLERYLMPVVPRPPVIDALSLMAEDAQGRFHLIRRAPLGG